MPLLGRQVEVQDFFLIERKTGETIYKIGVGIMEATYLQQRYSLTLNTDVCSCGDKAMSLWGASIDLS